MGLPRDLREVRKGKPSFRALGRECGEASSAHVRACPSTAIVSKDALEVDVTVDAMAACYAGDYN